MCPPIRKEGKSLHQRGCPLAARRDDQGLKGGGHPRTPTRAHAGQWGAGTDTSVCTPVCVFERSSVCLSVGMRLVSII